MSNSVGSPAPKWSIENQAPIGFGLAALIVIAVGITSYLSVRSFIDTNRLVTHTREVLQEVQDTRVTLVDAESSVRGFYITSDEAYLEPYQTALDAMSGHLAHLRSLTADNPVEQANVDKLEPLVTLRLQQFQTTVEQRQQNTQATLPAQTTPGPNKLTSDQARAVLDAMVTEENSLLEPRVSDADASARATLITLLALSALTLAILAAVYVLIRRDITGRKRAEATVAGERNVLRTLVDSLPDLIFVKGVDGTFILNNRAYAVSVGLPAPENLVGKSDFDIFPRELAVEYRRDEEAMIASGQPLINHEEPLVIASGETRVVQTTKIPLRNQAGDVDRIVGIAHDITERKRFEEHIQALNLSLESRTEQVEAANKELEAFSYTISHDLRAPLRAISGFSLILTEEFAPRLPADAARFLHRVNENANQMGDLIDDLLAFSRLGRQPLTKELVDTNALVRQVWAELIGPEPARSVELTVADLPPCSADLPLLRQVYSNLLANALKFTSKRDKARIEVGSRLEDGQTVYFVRDNGAGFDMQYAHKLFGVFQRLHRAEDYEGTGVGLAIVQRIVRRHGGQAWAEGTPDVGATFYFTLAGTEDTGES